MYINKCTKCGAEFETKNPKRMICPNCLYPDRKQGGEQGENPEGNSQQDSEQKSTEQKPTEQREYPNSYSSASFGGEEQQPYRPQNNYDRPRYDRNNSYNRYDRGGYNSDRPQRTYDGNRSGYGDRPQRNYDNRNSYGDRPQRSYNNNYNNNNGGGYQRNYGSNRTGYGDRPPRNYDNRNSYDRPQRNFGDRPQRSYNNRPQGNFGNNRRGSFNRRPPQRNKQLLISREQLEQIEIIYKKALPLPNHDIHEVIGAALEIEPRKVFFGINLVRQKMMLPKLAFPKRKLAVTPDQLTAIKMLYEPLLPLPPIGCHKLIATQLKMDEWRVHVGIGLVRKQMGLDRWNPDRADAPKEFKKK